MRMRLLAIGAVAGPWLLGGVAMATPPVAVSPNGQTAEACPTFSWSEAHGAAGYELVVYAVPAEEEVAGAPLVSARLPGGASSWTMPGGSCLTAGSRYAWTLRTLGEEGSEGWSEPVLFEVATAPSPGEVEAAITTLRRYLAEAREDESPAHELPGGAGPAEPGRALEAGTSAASPDSGLSGKGLTSQSGESIQSVSAASAPSLGAPSLTVDANIALGAASNVFKEGLPFLWDDPVTENTALGRNALSGSPDIANTAFGTNALSSNVGLGNVAVGALALRDNTEGDNNTAIGTNVLRVSTTGTGNVGVGGGALLTNSSGFQNVAVGQVAQRNNTTGSRNVAVGVFALQLNTSGSENTSVGSGSMTSLEAGDGNIVLGAGAGADLGSASGTPTTSLSDNIYIGNRGQPDEDHTIRIGTSETFSPTAVGPHNRTFIAGVRGVTTDISDAITVVIDSAGQLGTLSSSRKMKQDIRDVGELSERLLELRPVAFRYKVHAEEDRETPLEFGLIAEEVAEIFPELVVYDEEGKPETVKYRLLSTLLLNELQGMEARIIALERGEPVRAERRSWWRRVFSRERGSP